MSDGINKGRRNFLIGATSVVGAAGVVGVAVPFVASWNPSAKALAAGAPIKVDIGKLPEGDMLGPIPAWRSQPIFIVNRTKEMLDDMNKKNELERLLDPDSEQPQQPSYAQNDTRSIKPALLVMIGICTHLGCSPLFAPGVQPEPYDPNWIGGFYCPCHGSKYDLAGRVYKDQPAPLNMVIPPYYYESDSVVIVGKNKGEE